MTGERDRQPSRVVGEGSNGEGGRDWGEHDQHLTAPLAPALQTIRTSAPRALDGCLAWAPYNLFGWSVFSFNRQCPKNVVPASARHPTARSTAACGREVRGTDAALPCRSFIAPQPAPTSEAPQFGINNATSATPLGAGSGHDTPSRGLVQTLCEVSKPEPLAYTSA
jgi:hypothetical protein